MNQTTDAKRQAIKAAKQQKESQQETILTGIIDNESKTYTFESEIGIEGVRQTGTFKAKYMGVAARLRIGTIRAKLLDGAPEASVDALTDDIAYMIAYLTVALVSAPKWWNYDLIDDVQDLKKVYIEVYNFVRTFRGQNEQNSNVGSSSDATGTENVEDK